jgi:hypothetical protein
MTPRRPDAPGAAYDIDPDFWREDSQITLQPVAAPSILGLYGFAGAGTAAPGLIQFRPGEPGIRHGQ